MSAASPAPLLVSSVSDPPPVPSLELERLRREVKARLFGSESEALTIDRYRILGCIGQGGMGIVYAARDERLGRTVALKLLRPELSAGQREARSNLASEAQSLAKLSHPNVVAVFDVGEHDGQVFVAMEYVEGQSLRRWLETPRTLGKILDVYLAAGEGLAAAHRAGLVHRDFKPDNVLVGSDGRPRILDFGLARAPDQRQGGVVPPTFADDAEATATSVSRYGVLLGTPAYMAPEQHLGERADARSDQFGFCVALYQAIYRALPFPSDDLRALSLAIVTGRVTPPPVVPGEPARLRRLILRGLRVRPADRFADMDTLLTELRELRAGLDEEGELGAEREGLAFDRTQPLEPEPNFDTRAIERAFGLPGSSSGSSGRPGLSEAELDEIAEEVGLELRPRREGRDERDGSDAREAREQTSGLPEPVGRGLPEQTHFGLPATILSERMLPALPNDDTQRRIVRELERNLGGTGIAEQFDTGLAWANKEAEASIDRTAGGARLILRRSFAKLAHKRRRRGMIFGAAIGTVLGGILLDTIETLTALEFLEPLIVFGGTALGILAGTRLAQKIHARQVDEERALLAWVGERVEALVEADAQPRKALPASSRGGRRSS